MSDTYTASRITINLDVAKEDEQHLIKLFKKWFYDCEVAADDMNINTKVFEKEKT